MPIELLYDAENDYIAMQVTGRLDITAAKKYVPILREAMATHKCHRLLNDMRQADLAVSLVEYFRAPHQPFDALPPDARRAIVTSEKAARDLGFFETVSVNRGQTVKVFTDMDEAKHWLMEN
jgi:SpoIIAA-like